MSRQVYTLNESASLIQKLHRAGLTLVRDVTRLSAPQLAATAHLSAAQAEALLRRLLRQPVLTSCVTSSVTSPGHVVTFSRRLDALLGGGIPLGRLTQIAAPPGGGKTQLCLQACVDAALPTELGGLSASSIFVDTEDTFHASRLRALARAAAAHCRRVACDEETTRAAETFSEEVVMSRVRVVPLVSQEDVWVLPTVLMTEMQAEDVRLVVVDSIAAPFQDGGGGGGFSAGSAGVGEEGGVSGGDGETARRSAHLQWLAVELRRLARRHAAAIVITNHVTTVVEGGGAYLVPALGAGWQHCAAVQLYLEVSGPRRVARLLKHPDREEAATVFQILEVGVRDVCEGDPGLEGVGDCEMSDEEDSLVGGEGSGDVLESECDTADTSSVESESERVMGRLGNAGDHIVRAREKEGNGATGKHSVGKGSANASAEMPKAKLESHPAAKRRRIT